MEGENPLFIHYEKEKQRLLSLNTKGEIRGIYDSPVFGEGCLNPKLMIIGEAPGAKEAEQKKPFVGMAGNNLDSLLNKAGLLRREIFITNAVKYRPVKASPGSMRNRTPGIKEVKEGLPLLLEEILILKPGFIATLGNVPLSAICILCNIKPRQIGDAHGKPMAMQLKGHGFNLFPLYHPASIIYNRGLQESCERDIGVLRDIIVQAVK